MAYQQSFNDDEEQKQQQAQTGNETVLSPESSSISTSPAQGSSATTPSKPRGSGYTNLSQYADANKDQASKMAGQVTDTIAKNIQTARNSADTLGASTQQQAKENTIKDGGVIGQIQNHPQSLSDQDWVEQYKKNTAIYQGPQSIETNDNYSNVDKQFKDVDTQVKALNTNEGRYQAAKDTFSKPDNNYSRGQGLLDSFLLGTGAGSQELGQFQDTYNKNDHQGFWQNTVKDTNAAIDAAKKTSEDTKAQTEKAYQDKLGQFNSLFDSKQAYIDEDNAQNATGFTKIQGLLTSNDPQLRAQGAQMLGIDPLAVEWMIGQGYNPAQLAQQSAPRNIGDIVDSGDVKGYEALLGLTGTQSGYDFTPSGNQDVEYLPNQDALKSGQKAWEIQRDIKNRLGAEQGYRDEDFQNAQSALLGNTLVLSDPSAAAQALDIDPETYRKAVDMGLLSSEHLTPGAKINYGDVASDAERQQFNDLITQLGINPGIDLQDIQDEGSAYSFNKAGLEGDLSQALNKLINDKVKEEFLRDKELAKNTPTPSSSIEAPPPSIQQPLTQQEKYGVKQADSINLNPERSTGINNTNNGPWISPLSRYTRR